MKKPGVPDEEQNGFWVGRRAKDNLFVVNEMIERKKDGNDIVIMSESPDKFQSLLNAVDGYGRDFGVSFSSEKSKVMIVNRSEDERG
ncbi:hypothetical protein E2C01_049504 [Portunus trituberculatus]|uniref:Uncharacterized protein n=1 Tax=Portunus trituberculatus TaxID=210409 RepID=A0A5B7G9L7_PORTR|nr:hypothetical protein [Portunus trituberculatus]